MIGWMQHHKKWLVITLWISAIAFIGAGFVGWGSYNYGNKASSIAKIGKVDIKLSELQGTYNNLYSYYSRMFGGKFDEEMAKNMRLQETAFNVLKREALLQNLAIDFGLSVLDKEVAEHIYNSPDFQKDGQFNREQYELVLTNSRLSSKEYEDRLRKVILISKLQSLLKIKNTPLEIETINSLTRLKDKIEYKILYLSDIETTVSDEDVKGHWENTKTQYMTEEEYTISFIETAIIERDINKSELEEYFNTHALDYTGIFDEVADQVKEDLLKSESKKSALKDYLAFKKGNFEGKVQSVKIGGMNTILPLEEMQTLPSYNVGDFLKPIFSNGRFVSIRLDEVHSAEVEEFENVKMLVKSELEFKKSEEKLMTFAQNSYSNFEGIQSDFVSLSDIGQDVFVGLNPEEENQLINEMFLQSSSANFVRIGSKVVLYKVLEQEFSETGEELGEEIIYQLKEQLLNENLIKRLEYYYPVETYFKG
jgi:peptidyl-prolyl cis-trans isomerase D